MAIGPPEPKGAILTLSETFVRHFNAAEADHLVQAFYADDACLLPPNHPTITGRVAIGEAFRQFFEAGMGGLTIERYTVEVAGSGELAYGHGTFSLARPAPDRGKFVEVYRRQADGSWRCVVDMFSSDQPAS